MKKTLVAIAAVVATTGAMADVTIFGIVDQAYATTSTTAADGAKTTTNAIKPTYTGNELGFKGSEDLGNGMAADFQIHFGPTVDGGNSPVASQTTPYTVSGSSAPTNYQSWVGLKGDFGSLRVGQFFSPSFFNNATYDTVGYTAFGYNAGAVNGTSATLLANTIEYNLPSLVQGLTVSLSNNQGETAGASTGNQNNARINYAAGAFSVGYAAANINTSATTTTAQNSLGFSYDLGMAKIAYYTTSSKLSTATTTDTGNVYGVSIPYDAFTIGLQSSTGTVSSVSTSASLVQVMYALSKRTKLIFQQGMTDVSGSKVATAGSALGLWHSF